MSRPIDDPARLHLHAGRSAGGAGGGELALLLRAAHEDVLDDDAVARVRAGLGAAGVATAAGAAGVVASGAAGKGSSWMLGLLGSKLTALFLVGAAATAIVAAYAKHGEHAIAPATVSVPGPVADSVSVSAPDSVSTSDSVSASGSVSDSVAASPAPKPPPAATPAPTHASTTTAPASPPALPMPAAPAATSPREGLLLLQARQALGSNPARALTLVKQHEAEFPNSQLAPERDKLRHEAEGRTQITTP